jgi:hypothetical protein
MKDDKQPIKNMPESWDEAYAMQAEMNEGRDEFSDPLWSWDCNFKLDFDGPLVQVSSRFYPPAQHYGPGWDGTMNLHITDDIVIEKKFECETLEELKKGVEGWIEKVKQLISSELVDKINALP